MTQPTTNIGIPTATAIVIANMIGTGVFTSLGFQVAGLESGFAILALWFIGGIVALCGAFVYGELGTSLPRSGGEYHLLSEIYHPALGFLTGWISITVGFAAPVAAAAIAMGEYSSQVIIINNLDQKTMSNIIAITAVILITFIHFLHIGFISRFQIFFTGLKITLILAFIIFGFFIAKPQGSIDFSITLQGINEIFSANFAVSLVFVMYSYSGWNAAIYIVSEIKNPEKNLPIALFIGTFIVMILYVLLNAVFLYSAPVEAIKLQEEVGYIAALHIFGEKGGILMSVLIALGLISAISAMTWTGPRVTQVMGEDYKILSFFKYKNKQQIPIYALLAQSLIVIALILTASFEAIIYYIGFTLSLSVFLTVLGVFFVRQKANNQSYKTFGYPVTPLFFLAITAWMLFFIFKQQPIESIIGLVTVLAGLILYFINHMIGKKDA